MRNLALAVVVLLGLRAKAAVTAVDLSNADVRAAQPKFRQRSYEVGVADVEGPQGRWAFRYKVTKAWCGELPKWPSVNLKPSVTDWTPYDRLVIDVFNESTGGDVLCAFLAGPKGRIQDGLEPRPLPLEDYGYARWVIPLRNWPAKTDPKNIGRIHFFMTTPNAANVLTGGFHLLRPGEEPPPVSEKFMDEKVRPGLARKEALRRERRRTSIERFVRNCRAAGQDGAHCWVGKATGMEKIRPRDDFDAAGAEAFELKLARGECEALQVLVLPAAGDLADVTVEVSDLVRARQGFLDWFSAADTLPAAAFRVSPVGYVKTVNPAPYKGGFNVATNLSGGYFRRQRSCALGWWPDPILDHLDRATVKGDDVQSFWVRVRCPADASAGVHRGTLTVEAEGESARKLPFAVRVESPLTQWLYVVTSLPRQPIPL